MTLGGIILLVISWSTILSLVFFCFKRIFTAKEIK